MLSSNQTVSQQNWGGLNERINATIAPDGVYTRMQGLVPRQGKATRINGKAIKVQMGQPVLGIASFGNKVLVQLVGEVRLYNYEDIVN